MRHEPGLAARARVRRILEVEGKRYIVLSLQSSKLFSTRGVAAAKSSSLRCFSHPAEIFSAPVVQAPLRSTRNCFAPQIA